MKRKWLIVVAAVIVIGGGGYIAYDSYRFGFFSMPDLPEGAYPLSFKNGVRAIMDGVPKAEPDRKFVSRAFEVAPWFEKAWSTCTSPTEAESAEAEDLGPGTRFEAICRIDADGTKVLRGVIYSVPNH